MGKLSTILKATEYKKALDNYTDYISNAENRKSKRLKGGSAPVDRPRRRIALRLFGRELKADQYMGSSVTKDSWTKLNDKLASRAWVDESKLRQAETMKGITPAKVILFEPDSTGGAGATYRESKITKLYYLHRPGKSYSMSFGPSQDSEEFADAAILVKRAVSQIVANSDYGRVTITPEFIPT